MSTTTLPNLETEPVVAVKPRRRGRLRYSRNRLAYWLIAPAVAFMVLVHVLPMAGGVWLSFKNLNTFTFHKLFSAPWAGFDNYHSVLFEADNPLRSGFTAAVSNTVKYTFWTAPRNPLRSGLPASKRIAS